MSELSKLEKNYEQAKKTAYEAEANFFLNHCLDEKGPQETGDYLLALGADHRWGAAAILRIRKRLWGKKSYQFGLFPHGKDHEVLVGTQGMAPIASVAVAFGRWHIYPCPARCLNDVEEWIKAEKAEISL